MKHLMITCFLFGAVAYAGDGCDAGKDIGGSFINLTEAAASMPASDNCGL